MTLLGNPLDFLIAFFGGILATFTPCIYPLLPVSIGIIGANAQESRPRAITMSLLYVCGIALTYAALGVAASLTGTLFGRVSSYYLTYMIVGSVVLIFGISMSGLFHVPHFHLIKLPQFKNKGYLSSFILGLVSGLVASPCLTPVLGSILAYLTAKRNVLYGAVLLFSFAFGMGFILILIAATESAILAKLPKSGTWMHNIKRIFSLIMIVCGIYFIFIGLRRI